MAISLQDQTEADPLLAGEEAHRHSDGTAERRIERVHHSGVLGHERRGFAAHFQATKRTTILALLALILFTLVTSGMLILVPLFRITEDAVCHVFYDKPMSEPVEERLCKVQGVQSELAYLGGVSAAINAIVGLVTALPYGVLSDRIGRKPTFILSYVGIITTFAWGPLMLGAGDAPHIRPAVLSSLFFLIGGGIPVAISTLHAMASDVSSKSDRATGFLFLSFGALCGGLLGPVAAGLLMEHLGPWFPILVVFGTTPLVFGLLLFIPETLPTKMQTATRANDQRLPLVKILQEAAGELRVSLSLLRNPNIVLSLPVFLVQAVLFAAYSSTLAQHISTYFGWTLAQTSYLLSPLSLLQVVVIALVPRLSALLTNPSGRLGMSAFSKDLLLAKVSLLFIVVAALIEAFSRHITLFVVGLAIGKFGSSSEPLCRAVATSYVEPQQTSRLYALISMMETGGALLGGPVLAWCFNVGLSEKGLWVGLPWFYIAALVGLSLSALMLVKEPAVATVNPESSSNGDARVAPIREEPA